jgi:glycosyltransferase involved in cell wall biosynthesis
MNSKSKDRDIGDRMINCQISPGSDFFQDEIGQHSVSVIVPTFNRAQLIGRAIRSILNQTFRPAEIIVIDDCSSDDTESVISAYSGAIPLTYTRLEKNSGGAVARNVGILRANGEYVSFLDSDDEWYQDHLLFLMRAAVRQSGHFAVASSAMRIGGRKPRVLPGREYPQRHGVTQKLHFVISAPLAFQTSTLLMPQQTARSFMFDPHLRRHQDWDLVFRMIENDVPMLLLSDATINYYIPGVDGVSQTRSELPSLRFLVKHKDHMSSKTTTRFVAIQIMRRRYKGFRSIKYLLCAMILGGMSIKVFTYYVREACLLTISTILLSLRGRRLTQRNDTDMNRAGE